VFDEGKEDAESKDDEEDEKSAASDPTHMADPAASSNQGKAMFDLTMKTFKMFKQMVRKEFTVFESRNKNIYNDSRWPLKE
jgi:hypothetical protein